MNIKELLHKGAKQTALKSIIDYIDMLEEDIDVDDPRETYEFLTDFRSEIENNEEETLLSIIENAIDAEPSNDLYSNFPYLQLFHPEVIIGLSESERSALNYQLETILYDMALEYVDAKLEQNMLSTFNYDIDSRDFPSRGWGITSSGVEFEWQGESIELIDMSVKLDRTSLAEFDKIVAAHEDLEHAICQVIIEKLQDMIQLRPSYNVDFIADQDESHQLDTIANVEIGYIFHDQATIDNITSEIPNWKEWHYLLCDIRETLFKEIRSQLENMLDKGELDLRKSTMDIAPQDR